MFTPIIIFLFPPLFSCVFFFVINVTCYLCLLISFITFLNIILFTNSFYSFSVLFFLFCSLRLNSMNEDIEISLICYTYRLVLRGSFLRRALKALSYATLNALTILGLFLIGALKSLICSAGHLSFLGLFFIGALKSHMLFWTRSTSWIISFRALLGSFLTGALKFLLSRYYSLRCLIQNLLPRWIDYHTRLHTRTPPPMPLP